MNTALVEMVQRDGTRRTVRIEVCASGVLAVYVGSDEVRIQVGVTGRLIYSGTDLGLRQPDLGFGLPTVVLVVEPEVAK